MTTPTPGRITRAEYDRMVLAGVFEPSDRVELLEGAVCVMTPQSGRHANAVQLAVDELRKVFSGEFSVRCQLPLALDPDSEPEPDVAVVRAGPRQLGHHHPTTATLVVEIADTSLASDRGSKRSLYARARIPEYWIVNLPEQAIEVYRGPRRDGYHEFTRYTVADRLAPRGRESIAVRDLLP